MWVEHRNLRRLVLPLQILLKHPGRIRSVALIVWWVLDILLVLTRTSELRLVLFPALCGNLMETTLAPAVPMVLLIVTTRGLVLAWLLTTLTEWNPFNPTVLPSTGLMSVTIKFTALLTDALINLACFKVPSTFAVLFPTDGVVVGVDVVGVMAVVGAVVVFSLVPIRPTIPLNNLRLTTNSSTIYCSRGRICWFA